MSYSVSHTVASIKRGFDHSSSLSLQSLKQSEKIIRKVSLQKSHSFIASFHYHQLFVSLQVPIRHRNFIGHIHALVDRNILNRNDIIIQITACSFDVFLLETLAPSMLGLPLVLLPPAGHYDMMLLTKVIEKEMITAAELSPALMLTICDYLESSTHRDRLSSLRIITSGGKCSLFIQ